MRDGWASDQNVISRFSMPYIFSGKEMDVMKLAWQRYYEQGLMCYPA